jgi:hypothetical protein
MAFDTAKFDAALALLESKALLSPLTPTQREYLVMCRQNTLDGATDAPRLMHPRAYVVEVMCDVAGYHTGHPTAAAPAVSDEKRTELWARCLRVLKEDHV